MNYVVYIKFDLIYFSKIDLGLVKIKPC